MKMDFEQFGFSIETTLDGSPTLRLKKPIENSTKPPESMHHSGGAATETRYIYGNPINEAFNVFPKNKEPLKVCVIGLGLGYIEMTWAQAVNNHRVESSCDSFEIAAELKESFIKWLKGSTNKESIYYKCLDGLGVKYSENIIQTLKHNFLVENHFYSDLRQKENYQNKKWHLIAYDAFSRKTNEELWSETFLTHWFSRYCEEDAMVMTYACTGALKRSLEHNGFIFIKRPGFQGKRDATLAYRGCFSKIKIE